MAPQVVTTTAAAIGGIHMDAHPIAVASGKVFLAVLTSPPVQSVHVFSGSVGQPLVSDSSNGISSVRLGTKGDVGHENPSLFRLADDRLFLTYGAMTAGIGNGTASGRNLGPYWRVSQRPADGNAWSAEGRIPIPGAFSEIT